MGVHQITMPVRGDGKGDAVFAHAAALAQRFRAHVQVVHCRPKAADMMPYGVVVPNFLRDQLRDVTTRAAEAQEDDLRAKYRDLAAQLGLAEHAPETGRATTEFVEYTGKQMDAVKHHGRLADLICVPKPDKGAGLGFNTLKSALFTSGRPVMMCPDQMQVTPDLGRHVALGWNGSLEATRALALGMPLLESAAEITILTTGHEPHATTAEELQSYLAIRGLSSAVRRFERQGSVGRGLLTEASGAGADLLLMGAYHVSYEKEAIFGGNTQVVVDEATCPVVFVH